MPFPKFVHVHPADRVDNKVHRLIGLLATEPSLYETKKSTARSRVAMDIDHELSRFEKSQYQDAKTAVEDALESGALTFVGSL